MCSDSEQPFEGTKPRLIFSSYIFRNKKNKCCRAERAASRHWELKLTSLFSCFLFYSQGRLHCRVNPLELVLPPRLQSRGPHSAPNTVSVNTKWWRKIEKEGNPLALLWISVKISSICYILCFPCGGTHKGSEITPLTATLVCTAIKQVNV